MILIAACGEGTVARQDDATARRQAVTARERLIQAMSQRAAGASRVIYYDTLAELLPNTKYQVGSGPARSLTEAAVVGRIADVRRGLGFYMPDGDAPRGTETDFDDPRVMWRTVHATVAIESVVAGEIRQSDPVTVGFAFGHTPDFSDIERGLKDLGRVVLLLNKSPVFDYNLDVYGTATDGELVGLVDDDGRITLPFAGDAEGTLLRDSGTVDALRHAAGRPESTIYLDESGTRRPSRSPTPRPSSTPSFTITTQPDPVRHGEEAIITISGRAYGGRHLSWWSIEYGDGMGVGRSPGCVAKPSHEPAVDDDQYTEHVPYTWDEPGTYTLTVKLSAPCRTDIPSHTVTTEIAVQ